MSLIKMLSIGLISVAVLAGCASEKSTTKNTNVQQVDLVESDAKGQSDESNSSAKLDETQALKEVKEAKEAKAEEAKPEVDETQQESQNVEPKEENQTMEENEALYTVPVGYDQPYEGSAYGTLKTITYYSKTTGTERKAKVLLPAGYSEDKKYPVLYLLHGIGGDENEWLYGKPVNIIGNLIHAKEVDEMIVVFPNVRARADDTANPKDIFTLEHFAAFDNFINDLMEDLMPYMEANYPIKRGRENTAIAGLSMGGREALYIGISKPETFGYIGAFCPAIGVFGYSNGNVTEKGLFTEETFTLPKELETVVMIVKGTEDGVVNDEPLKYHNALVKNNVPHIYYETAGGHDFTVWNHGLYHFAKTLFK